MSKISHILQKISAENGWNPELKPFTAYFHLIITIFFDLFNIFAIFLGMIAIGWWMVFFLPFPVIFAACEVYFFQRRDFAIRYFSMTSTITGMVFMLAIGDLLHPWVLVGITVTAIVLFCKNYNDTRFVNQRQLI